ncbi:MAG: antitoxin VapB family protein [Luteolibacter sp.]
MKTITLDEVAYERLKAWKKGSRESFSSVVKRVIPEPGTLGAMLSFVQTRAELDSEKDEILEQTVNQRPSVKEDPWS